MESKSILEVEESVQGALEALPSIVRHSSSTPTMRQIGAVLDILAPAGYHPVVELQENGRRKRRTASAENWNPETGEILITFSREQSVERPERAAESTAPPVFLGPRHRHLMAIREQQYADRGSAVDDKGAVSSRSSQMTAAAPASTQTFAGSAASAPTNLDDAEQDICRTLDEVERQGRAFIALKWFRDDVLASKGFAWAVEAEGRQAVLARAIEKGLVVTSRVPNPRSSFPTTAVRLNRSKLAGQAEGQRYSPIRIQGEPLSSTILRDRGAR